MRYMTTTKRFLATLFLTTGGLGAQLFVGCSLTSIPFVRVGECESDASCNEALGAKCAEYECVDTTDKKGESFTQCKKIKGERLDGLDNDCDGIIDNAGQGETPLTQTQAVEIISGLDSFTTLSLASSRAFTQLYIQKDMGVLLAAPPEGGEPAPVTMMAQANNTELQTELTLGCFSPNNMSAGTCDINQAAVAAGSKLGFFAQIKSTGCRQGELRVGAIDPEEPDEFIDRGPTFRNPSYQGVATYGSPCSDNGRPACVEAKQQYADLAAQDASDPALSALQDTITDSCGVSRPSVAALDDQALVTFLGAGSEEDICETGPVDVFGLLLHERTGLRNGEFYWADPSADGIPQLLGSTISAQPPAVREIGTLGFLMAHPDVRGSLTLTFIPKQGAPPGNGGVDCPEGDCDSREGLETAPISGAQELAKLTTSGAADGVRLQWITVNDEEGVLLITWVSGCSPLDDQLEGAAAYAQALRVDISGTTPEILWEGDVINLGSTRSFPLAVPSTQDFVIEGFERDNRTATTEDLGGFFVLTRPLQVQAVRIAAFDGALVAKDEVIPIHPFADDPDARPNAYRYLGAMGEADPDQFYFGITGGGSLYRATFASGN